MTTTNQFRIPFTSPRGARLVLLLDPSDDTFGIGTQDDPENYGDGIPLTGGSATIPQAIADWEDELLGEVQ